MIQIHKMYHHKGTVIFQDVAEDWYELQYYDPSKGMWEEVVIEKIEKPQ